MLSAMNDPALFIILRLGAVTEDAAGGLLAARSSDVGVAPRRPDVIHGKDSLTFDRDFGFYVWEHSSIGLRTHSMQAIVPVSRFVFTRLFFLYIFLNPLFSHA